MKRVVLFPLLALLLFAGCSGGFDRNVRAESPAYYTDIPDLTDEEANAIEALRLLYRDGFVYACGFGTECYLLPDGTQAGFAVEFCKLLTSLFGIPFKPVTYEWNTLLDGFNAKTIDFTGEFTKTPERQQLYTMSLPVAERSLSLFTRADNHRFTNENDLDGARLGFLRGVITEQYVRDAYDIAFETVWAENGDQLLTMIEDGTLDAFVLESYNSIYFENNPQIKHMPFFPLVYTSVSLSTANPTLAPVITVLDKYINAGGIDTLYEIYQSCENIYNKNHFYQSLTAEEQAYLTGIRDGGTAITIAYEADNYPYCFFNQNEQAFQGIAPDVLDKITELTGLQFENVVSKNTEWSEILRMLRENRVAMVSQLLYTDARKHDFLWPETSYATSYYALISKSEYPDLAIYQVLRARVGYIANTAYADKYNEWFPDSDNQFTFKSTTACYDALDTGEVDLIMSSESDLLARLHYQEKVGYKVNIRFNTPLYSYFGFNKNEAVLCSVIDKALALIDTASISRDWSSRVFDYSVKLANQRAIYMTLLIAILVTALVALSIFTIQNMRLNKVWRDAERESRMKSAFLANMSHEIRTPMNSIVGFTDLAIEYAASERTRDYLEKIKLSSGILLQIINDILDVTKMESGGMALEHIAFHVSDVFSACQTVIGPKAEEKGITLYCYAEPSVGKCLMGDPTRLRQVLLNLLSNAVKFTNTGMVKLLSAIVDKTADSVTIRFEVKDSGIGMSPEQLGRIFNPFTQGDVSTTRKYGGTGLGLAIASNLVLMMGGKLEVESALGVGSKFNFTLTFQTADIPQDEPPPTPVAETMNRPVFIGQVLLCEDNALNQQVIRDHLTRVGLRSVVAWNGRECLDIIRGRSVPFDLIFMDIHMPVMDGLDAALNLRQMGCQTPIVALTANVMPEERAIYKQHGMDYYMAKPFTAQELWRCLLRFLKPAGTVTGTVDAVAEERFRMKTLSVFVSEYRTAASDIEEALQAGDINLAHRRAHSLKSVAGLVGASRLAETARVAEALLANGENNMTDTQMETLRQALAEAIEKYAPLVRAQAPDTVPVETLDSTEAAALLDRIGELLRLNDSDCLDLTDQLKSIPGTQQLIDLIEAYDFVPALEELHRIKSVMRGEEAADGADGI